MIALGWLSIGLGFLLIGVAVSLRLCRLATEYVEQVAPPAQRHGSACAASAWSGCFVRDGADD